MDPRPKNKIVQCKKKSKTESDIPDPKPELRLLLDSLMAERRLEPEDLAKRVSRQKSTVKGWKDNKIFPKKGELEKLIKALHLDSMDQLVTVDHKFSVWEYIRKKYKGKRKVRFFLRSFETSARRDYYRFDRSYVSTKDIEAMFILQREICREFETEVVTIPSLDDQAPEEVYDYDEPNTINFYIGSQKVLGSVNRIVAFNFLKRISVDDEEVFPFTFRFKDYKSDVKNEPLVKNDDSLDEELKGFASGIVNNADETFTCRAGYSSLKDAGMIMADNRKNILNILLMGCSAVGTIASAHIILNNNIFSFSYNQMGNGFQIVFDCRYQMTDSRIRPGFDDRKLLPEFIQVLEERWF